MTPTTKPRRGLKRDGSGYMDPMHAPRHNVEYRPQLNQNERRVGWQVWIDGEWNQTCATLGDAVANAFAAIQTPEKLIDIL